MTRRRNGREWKEKYWKWIMWCCRVSPRLLRTLSVSPPNLSILHASVSISCMFIVPVVAACMCLWLPFSKFNASCKAFFLDININNLTAIAEGEIVTIFHIWWDTELVTLILGAHLEAAASFQQHPYFEHCLLSWQPLCILSGSALLAKRACGHIKRLWLFLYLSMNLLITFHTLRDIQE